MARGSSKVGTLNIEPPIGGVVRSFNLTNQPPFTCIESVNYWPIDVLDGRRVTATRPPLDGITSPDAQVNMLGQLNTPTPTLFAAANGVFYKWTGSAWSAVSSSVGIVATRPVFNTPFGKKLYIFNDDTPLIYDYTANTLTNWTASEGTVPSDCRVGCTSQGCVWLGGNEDNPNVFSLSRTGNPLDFDFTVADTGGAFQATGEQFGLITEPIVAMIAWTQSLTLIACERSLWVFNGHPRRGGELNCMNSAIGMLGQGAWCVTPNGSLYFLSKSGLMHLQPGGVPTPVSRDKIPEQLIGLEYDPLNPTVSMAYDVRWNGVIICVRGDDEQSWWYDPELGSFSQMKFADYPTVMMHFDPFVTDDASGALFGGSGYDGLARFDRTGSEQLVEAKQIIGPMRISASPRYKTMIRRADFMFGGDTDELDGTVTFHTGSTGAVAAYRAQTESTLFKHSCDVGDLIANRRATFPLIAGHAVCLTIKQPVNSTKRIIYEGCACELDDAGFSVDSGLIPPVVSTPAISFSLSAS